MASATGSVGSKNAVSGANAQYDQSFMPSGAQRVADGHGRYTDTALRGRAFLASNAAGVAVTALNATATGLILTNPVASGQYISLLEVGSQQAVAATTAIATLQLAWGAVSATPVTHTTPVTVRNLPLGNAGVGVGLVDSSSTLPAAPVCVFNLWSPSVSATATTGIPPVVNKDFGGLMMTAPGTSFSMSATTASTMASTFIWEEIPINAQYS